MLREFVVVSPDVDLFGDLLLLLFDVGVVGLEDILVSARRFSRVNGNGGVMGLTVASGV